MYAGGTVTGTNRVGGLVGLADAGQNIHIHNSYSSATVTETQIKDGLNNEAAGGGAIGVLLIDSGTISIQNNFVVGSVNGPGNTGAFFGYITDLNSPTFETNYFDVRATGQTECVVSVIHNLVWE